MAPSGIKQVESRMLIYPDKTPCVPAGDIRGFLLSDLNPSESASYDGKVEDIYAGNWDVEIFSIIFGCHLTSLWQYDSWPGCVCRMVFFCLERFFNVPRSDKKIWIFSIRAQRLRTKPIPAYLSFIYLFRDIGHRRSFCSEKVPF